MFYIIAVAHDIILKKFYDYLRFTPWHPMIDENIWRQLKRPFFAQAPMEAVTDTVFRRLLAKLGKPDLFFTEFANCEGLNSPGRDAVGKRLVFTEEETPIIAQIWGTNPENFYKTAKSLSEMNFAGLDINMGCPSKDVINNGAGAGLINNQTLAGEIIAATKEGANSLPVSVKTRLGYSRIETEEWIGFLLKQNIDALTIHVRTRKEGFTEITHWDEMEKVVKLRNAISSNTVLIGNGSIQTQEDGIEKAEHYKIEGIMIGRALISNPWFFNDKIKKDCLTLKEKLDALLFLLSTYKEIHPNDKVFPMRKYFKAFISGFDGAKELREQLMTIEEIDTLIGFIQSKMKGNE